MDLTDPWDDHDKVKTLLKVGILLVINPTYLNYILIGMINRDKAFSFFEM